MKKLVFSTPDELGAACATEAARIINNAIAKKNNARIILSTGASQFDTIKHLRCQSIDWEKVEMFHLDEYIGIDETHPASFVKYLRERFADGLPLAAAHYICGASDPLEVISGIKKQIQLKPIDVALIGIGENAHIAFNDPPADFHTEESFIIVDLDSTCKIQQVREGWFASVDDVPRCAITMSVHQIMQAKAILSAVPFAQKAAAIKATLENDVTCMIPATILKTHPDWTLFLDRESAG